MKYIRQFTIILIISFLGEVLKELIPLSIPSSIYGVVLMLTALCTGIIKLESVREAGHMLTRNMQLLFIPATVGLMVSWDQIQGILIPVAILASISTVIVMVVSGRVTQKTIRVMEEWELVFGDYPEEKNRSRNREL